MTKLLIGQFLVAEGLLPDEAIVRALKYQRSNGQYLRLGTILLGWEVISEEAFLAALGKFHHCAIVPWSVLSKASANALRNLPALHAIRLEAVPYLIESGSLYIAFRNPSDIAVIDEASQIAGRRVLPAASSEVRLALAQQRFYGNPLPVQFKPVLQRLDRRKPPPASNAVVAADPPEIPADKAPSFYEYAAPAAAAGPGRSWEVAESVATSIPARTEPIPTIEIPSFPAAAPDAAAAPARPARSRDEVLAPILESLLCRFSRVILFGLGKSAVTGWAGGGPGLSPALVAGIRIPTTEENVLSEVAQSGVPHIGPVDRGRFPRALRGVLGRETVECAVFPVRVLGTVAGLLYADHLGVPLPAADFAVLARGAASAASVLSEFLRRGGAEE